HEGAGGGIGLDEASHVDIALGDDTVKWRDHALIILLLQQNVELLLLGDEVRLRDADRRGLGIYRLLVDGALLLRQPALVDQRLVAAPGDIRKIGARLRLTQSRCAL